MATRKSSKLICDPMAPRLIKYLIFLTEHIATAETDGALGQQIKGADKKGKLTSFRWGLRSKRKSFRDQHDFQNESVKSAQMGERHENSTLNFQLNFYTNDIRCFNLSFPLKSPHGDGPLETEPSHDFLKIIASTIHAACRVCGLVDAALAAWIEVKAEGRPSLPRDGCTRSPWCVIVL